MPTSEVVPFTCRRARLLQGMTQAQFAEEFEVDDGTVSRWERGRLHPSPQVWARINEIIARKGVVTGDVGIKASPTYKFLMPMGNLHNPMALSKGTIAALARMGIPYEDMASEQMFAEQAKASPDFEVSAYHALDLIEASPGWITGEVLYAEAHCIATRMNLWVDMMVSPIPERYSALIEAVPSYCGSAGSFWVNLVFVNGTTRRI